jgi:hypothetical protein
VVRGEGRGAGEGATGFALRGPFALPRGTRGLPTARVAYTQIAGTKEATVTLVSTGRDAFVEVGGEAYRLPEREQRELQLGPDLRSAVGDRLRVEDWVRDPELDAGPPIAGADTQRVVGELEVARAVNGLLGLADRAGAEAAGLRPLRGARAAELERSVRSSRVELLTGADDRLLRRLSIELALTPPRRTGAGGGGGPELVRIAFDLSLRRPNGAVRVVPPPGARPYGELRTQR